MSESVSMYLHSFMIHIIIKTSSETGGRKR